VTRDEALRRVAEARVGRIATVRPDGTPHVVPLVFALTGGGDDVSLVWAVDDKPKRSARLARIANLRANPIAEVVVDAYDEDWSRLWWVRLRGPARVLEGPKEREAALDVLADKYPAYRELRPSGDVVRIDVDSVTWWSAADG
jgi:PPOX class probable F420-dependent enzyme